MRLIDFFDKGASLDPDRPCFEEGDDVQPYSATAELSHRIANGLIQAGIRPDARVGVYSPNSAAAFTAVLGVLRAGAVWLPVNVRNPEDENRRFLAENCCEFLFFHSKFAEQAARVAQALPSIRQIVCVDRPLGAVPALGEWASRFASMAPFVDRRPDDVAIIKSTGGTTGRPKSVMITNLNMETMIASFLACISVPEAPVHLMAVPMTHGAGNITFALMARGATTVILDRADPDGILDAIERRRVTILFLPPTVIYGLLGRPDIRTRNFRSLRNLIYSAAPMSADKLDEAIEIFGPVMTQAYGQTEAPLLCTFMSPEEHLIADDADRRKRLLSCGRATPFVTLEIMDDAGRLLSVGETGEIVVRGNLVMKGYADNPQETAKVSEFGWHHTGDVGYRDSAGYLYIVDRKKDMIISGGFNIYPSEIEQVLWSHPAVQDCAVIGVPDGKWGEAVKAIVELKPAISAREDELVSYCKARLGGLKAPKSLEIWPELPRSAVGKVLKRAIRDRYWTGRERQV